MRGFKEQLSQDGREIIDIATKYDTKFMVGYNQKDISITKLQIQWGNHAEKQME